MRIAVLGNAGSWYVNDLARAAEQQGHQLARHDFAMLSGNVALHATDLSGEDSIDDFDAVIVRSMPPGSLEQVVFRMDLLGRLEAGGIVVLNSPKSLECAIDKYLTTARMDAAGLPVPCTVTCQDEETAMQAFEVLGGDVVVKPLFGSEGRGICRVSDPDLAFRTFRTLQRTGAVLYVQEFIEHEGFDIRVLVLDGRILGGMKRFGNGDFRTNVSRSARTEPHAPSDHECALALRAADCVGARFAGVDLLRAANGRYSVIEVNAVPGWRAFARVNDVDVAADVIRACNSGLSE